MDVNEAMSKYVEKFGFFPHFLVMGMGDEELIKLIEYSLETGEEIEAEEGKIY